MPTPFDDFINSIELKKRQLDEVLEAYRVFREKLDALPPEMRIQAQQSLSPNDATPVTAPLQNSDFVGQNAMQCVFTLLKERNNKPIHFSEAAKQALVRGYRGRLTGTPEEVETRTITSFWSAMSRDDELISVGKGLYRMRDEGDDEAPEEADEPVKKPAETRTEQVRRFLRKNGPSRRKEIIDNTGIPEGTMGMVLKEGPDTPFARTSEGLWYSRTPNANGSPSEGTDHGDQS